MNPPCIGLLRALETVHLRDPSSGRQLRVQPASNSGARFGFGVSAFRKVLAQSSIVDPRFWRFERARYRRPVMPVTSCLSIFRSGDAEYSLKSINRALTA